MRSKYVDGDLSEVLGADSGKLADHVHDSSGSPALWAVQEHDHGVSLTDLRDSKGELADGEKKAIENPAKVVLLLIRAGVQGSNSEGQCHIPGCHRRYATSGNA